MINSYVMIVICTINAWILTTANYVKLFVFNCLYLIKFITLFLCYYYALLRKQSIYIWIHIFYKYKIYRISNRRIFLILQNTDILGQIQKIHLHIVSLGRCQVSWGSISSSFSLSRWSRAGLFVDVPYLCLSVTCK